MTETSQVYWFRLCFPGEPPSDAIPVSLETGDVTVLDLKRRLLEEVKEALPRATALPWITLILPAVSGVAVRQLDSSEDLSELPEGAGGRKRHIHAHIRFVGSVGPPPPSSKVAAPKKPRGEGTLFEQGIAGPDEPAHIRNAKDFSDLMPGGKVRQGDSDNFDLRKITKILLVFGALMLLGLAILYCLENTPRWQKAFERYQQGRLRQDLAGGHGDEL
eukprot:TRINITY_DN36074_c0_g1_i1.p1 TRINITY_DN36074_c0_g1~~TRINITY_DN36074_c0_g1_i1.p1  ORF type:complete len:218 (+),score=37.05 TRINITY_DN36074_c0_g1_i1:238-891(+)